MAYLLTWTKAGMKYNANSVYKFFFLKYNEKTASCITMIPAQAEVSMVTHWASSPPILRRRLPGFVFIIVVVFVFIIIIVIIIVIIMQLYFPSYVEAAGCDCHNGHEHMSQV